MKQSEIINIRAAEARTLVCASQALAKISAVLLLEVNSARTYLAM